MKAYYKRGGITIYHGDSREIAPQLRDVELLLSDPPYGIDFNTDYRRFTTGFAVKRSKHRPVHGDAEPFDPTPWLKYPKVILWGANCFGATLPRGRMLVWDKRFANGKAFLADAEIAWMKGGHGVYIYAQTWQGCVRSERVQHPTQKPLDLMRWCFDRARPKGLTLDPFMGSGTTLVAAASLDLPAIGIEIDERYCEIAAERLDTARERAA